MAKQIDPKLDQLSWIGIGNGQTDLGRFFKQIDKVMSRSVGFGQGKKELASFDQSRLWIIRTEWS